MQSLQVCLVSKQFTIGGSGAEIYVHELSNGLGDRDYEVGISPHWTDRPNEPDNTKIVFQQSCRENDEQFIMLGTRTTTESATVVWRLGDAPTVQDTISGDSLMHGCASSERDIDMTTEPVSGSNPTKSIKERLEALQYCN